MLAVRSRVKATHLPRPCTYTTTTTATAAAATGGASAASEWKVTVGVEVHAQIAVKTKLFSGAPAEFDDRPNRNVALVDAGVPGAMPILNSNCVAQALRTGLALGGKINETSYFDRKHYFYPDLPTGYQITQKRVPIVSGGSLRIDPHRPRHSVRINSVILEQDSGRSVHDAHPAATLVDLNRAGVALMEIVSEPDIRSSEDAGLYVASLQSLLTHLGTCRGSMELGELRCDVNVSVSKSDSVLGQRTEVKNINSIRNVVQAVESEAARQIAVLESGGTIKHATLGFDAVAGTTTHQRDKESEADYRFCPEPDLPPLLVSREMIEETARNLPELPFDRILRFVDAYGMTLHDAQVLVDWEGAAEYFEAVATGIAHTSTTPRSPQRCVAWVANELFGRLKREGCSVADSPVSPQQLGSVIDAIDAGVISGKVAKAIFRDMFEGDSRSAHEIAESKGLGQISDTAKLSELVQTVVEKHPDEVAAIRGGKDRVFGYLVGQVMKETRGRADAKVVTELMRAAVAKGE